jgi:hypothetical protein
MLNGYVNKLSTYLMVMYSLLKEVRQLVMCLLL